MLIFFAILACIGDLPEDGETGLDDLGGEDTGDSGDTGDTADTAA